MVVVTVFVCPGLLSLWPLSTTFDSGSSLDMSVDLSVALHVGALAGSCAGAHAENSAHLLVLKC